MTNLKFVIAIVICFPSSISLAQHSSEGIIRLVFVDHLKAGLIEQDVFVEKDPGSNHVYRVLPSEKDHFINAAIFTTSAGHHHDPFDESKTGPYKKGHALDMTLKQWLSAVGTADYSCEEGWGHFKANFRNLVPEATYTMWHFFMPAPPTIPFTGTLDIPMGDRTGKQSIFKTDSHGNANIDVTFEHCLQLGGDQLMSGMAIALHSDDKTYGSEPGAFGKVAHVQLFAMLPKEEEIKKY